MQTRLPNSVIFDLDGTLVNSEPLQYRAYRDVLDEHGIEFDDSLFRTFVGMRASEIFRILRQRYSLASPLERLVQLRADKYRASLTNISAMPGAISLVRLLHKRGVKVAIASSASYATICMMLRHIGLTNEVKVIVSAEEVAAGKPDPSVYLVALARLGEDASSCVGIEDSEIGVRASAAAQLFTIAVPNEYTCDHDFSAANIRLSNLNEVYPAISNWSQGTRS